MLDLCIDDEGAGLPNASNLFVPFSRRSRADRIGLVLSRQIAEAHGGRRRWKTAPTGAGVASSCIPL
jgi:signal transduction histidine kinase